MTAMDVYSAFDSTSISKSDIARSGTPTTVVATVLLTFVFVVILTRILTETPARARDGKVPLLPYWVPYLGHTIDIYLSPQRVLEKGAQISLNGSFALYVYGRRRVVLCTASAVEQALKDCPSNDPALFVLYNVAWVSSTQRLSPELLQAWNVWTEKLHAPSVVRHIQVLLQTNVPNLVTGAESRIDEAPWEKGVSTKVLRRAPQGNNFETECDLFQMLDEFSKYALLDGLVGSSGQESYGELANQLRALTANITPLGLAIPQVVGFVMPMPGLLAAHRARNRCLRAVGKFDTLEDDRPFETLRNALSKASKSSVRTRLELACLWNASKDFGPLLFWLILHILTSSQDIMKAIQTEAESIVSVKEMPPIVPGSQIKEPPQLNVNHEVLENPQSFPVLYAYYLETIRLYSQSVTSLGQRNERTSEEEERQKPQRSNLSRTYISWGLCLRNIETTQGSNSFNPRQYLNTASDSISPQLINHPKVMEMSLFLTNPFRLNDFRSIVLLAVASILLLWKIKPAEERKSWQGRKIPQDSWQEFRQPGKKYTLGIALPTQDVKVRITRL